MHNMRVIFALITLNAYVRNFVDIPKIFRIAHQGKYYIISLQRNTSNFAPRYSKITYEIFSLYLNQGGWTMDMHLKFDCDVNHFTFS